MLEQVHSSIIVGDGRVGSSIREMGGASDVTVREPERQRWKESEKEKKRSREKQSAR